jgi:hypothetical protein
MTRGVRQNKLVKKDLCERLGLPTNEDALKKTRIVELIKQAVQRNLLTDEELNNSLPTTSSVIKCYLRSVVTDTEALDRLETYVKMASLLYIRGTYIANLMAVDAFGDVEGCKEVPRYDGSLNRESSDVLFDFVENNTYKHVFLPERWPNADTDVDVQIKNVVNNHAATLNSLFPNEWKNFMSVSGWDNAINRMYTKYHANVEVHVKCHLLQNVPKYFEKVQKAGVQPDADKETQKLYSGLLKWLFSHPLRPLIVHNDDYALVTELRESFGVEIDNYAPTSCEYNKNTFHMFMYFVKAGVAGKTYLPVAKLGRKYAYVDGKISKYLVPSLYKRAAGKNATQPSLSQVFGLTSEAYRTRRKLLRQQLRRKYSRAGDERSKRLKRKWRQIGWSNMPQKAMVFSFETDGVGMSICIQTPNFSKLEETNEPKKKLTKQEYADACCVARKAAIDAVPKTSMFVGIDLGRAKAFTAAVAENPLKPPTTVLLTRNAYYNAMKHTKRMKFERNRMAQTAVATASAALSEAPKANFAAYVATVATHANTLKSEYIEDKTRALWSMRLYRLKKQALDRSVQKIFDRGKGKPLCIGIGDAKISSTGRNERSMPTCQIMKTFMKAKRRYKGEVYFRNINEFRTTMCCCACGSVTNAPRVAARNADVATRPSRRLRLCTVCNETVGRMRDRDVQAARNMLWLTQHEVLGGDCRPWYLCRPRRSITTT